MPATPVMDLTVGPKLVPAEASAALLVTPDDEFVLQRRDDKPEIFFPGWLGCFGGGLDPGETPEDCLRRELQEELGLADVALMHFCSIGLDFGFAGYGLLPRHFFHVPIDPSDVPNLTLAEGRAIEVVPGREILSGKPVIPYDATAIWMYLSKGRF